MSETDTVPTAQTLIAFESSALTNLAFIVVTFAAIGLASGVNVMLIGERAGMLAGLSVGGLVVWFFPYIGPVIGGLLALVANARVDTSVGQSVVVSAVGAALGFAVMVGITIPFIMVQASQTTVGLNVMITVSLKSMLGAGLAGAVGGYVGVPY